MTCSLFLLGRRIILKTISILGSTGSIGTQALDVVRMHNIKIKALSANSNVKLLERQAREFSAQYVCIADSSLYKDLKDTLKDTSIKVLTGEEGLCQIAELDNVDIMLNSVVGMVGLLPTLKAIEHKTNIALANKETLVAGGQIVMNLAKKNNVSILPVDSEHSAIFQCLQGNKNNEIDKIILTASGGPFYGKTLNELKKVTVQDALNHPNWSMGNKITIDSATLMNKGLEFIEAKWLFNLKPEQIEIVVHRQSVLHSAVQYKDYSIIAQMGVPDMKIPIQYAILYPDRLSCPTKQLSLTDYGNLTFSKPDYETFTCLSSAIKAIKMGGAYPCIVNSANEELVKLFLEGKILFLQIGENIEKALKYFKLSDCNTYDDVKKYDKQAREFILNLVL